MLEDIAIKYSTQSEDIIKLIGLTLGLVGAVIAGLFLKSGVELKRAPYFAYMGLIIFFSSAAQLVWLLALPALAGGYLWLCMLVSLISSLAAGFFLAQIAMARSRDAYGHGGMAFLAFIPIANFWLMLKSSRKSASEREALRKRVLINTFCLAVGVFLFVLGVVVTNFLRDQAQQTEQQASTDPASQRSIIESIVKNNGVEKALQVMIRQSSIPHIIDNVTILSSVEATGSQLRRVYLVDLEDVEMTSEFERRIVGNICDYPPFWPLLRAGASIQEVYRKRSGQEIGAVTVEQSNCPSLRG